MRARERKMKREVAWSRSRVKFDLVTVTCSFVTSSPFDPLLSISTETLSVCRSFKSSTGSRFSRCDASSSFNSFSGREKSSREGILINFNFSSPPSINEAEVMKIHFLTCWKFIHPHAIRAIEEISSSSRNLAIKNVEFLFLTQFRHLRGGWAFVGGEKGIFRNLMKTREVPRLGWRGERKIDQHESYDEVPSFVFLSLFSLLCCCCCGISYHREF